MHMYIFEYFIHYFIPNVVVVIVIAEWRVVFQRCSSLRGVVCSVSGWLAGWFMNPVIRTTVLY